MHLHAGLRDLIPLVLGFLLGYWFRGRGSKKEGESRGIKLEKL